MVGNTHIHALAIHVHFQVRTIWCRFQNDIAEIRTWIMWGTSRRCATATVLVSADR